MRIATGAVLLLIVAFLGIASRPAPEPTDLADAIPFEDWPPSVDLAGVEIEVIIQDAPDEAMQSRVTLGEGDAAFNWEPSGLAELGNTSFQRFQNRRWFTCGNDQVVRMTETGSADNVPTFTIAGPSRGRFLPTGAIVPGWWPGSAAADAELQRGGGRFTCGQASILVYPTSGDLVSVERLVEAIGCLPSLPDELRLGASPASLLLDLGVDEVRAARSDSAIADVTALVDGRQYRIRAGGTSQVALDPDVLGVEFTCGTGYSIEILDDGTQDDAQALANRIAQDPGCPLDEVFGPTGTS